MKLLPFKSEHIEYGRNVIRELPQRVKKCFSDDHDAKVASLLDIRTDDAVLDISCGNGSWLSGLRGSLPAIMLYGIDVQENLIREAQQKYFWGTFAVASAENLPYESEHFSALFSCMSLHHYQNPAKVFKEAARVLTRDGILYIVDLIPWFRFQQLLWNWDGCPESYHFEKYYTVADIKQLALKNGLLLKRHHALSPTSGKKLVVLQKK